MWAEQVGIASIIAVPYFFAIWHARELRRERAMRIEVEKFLRDEITNRDNRITDILESQRKGVDQALRFVRAESSRMIAPLPQKDVPRGTSRAMNGESHRILPDED